MNATPTKSSKINPAVVLVIGGIIILFIVSLTTKFFPKTGVKTDLKDVEKGKITFKDTKTDQTVNVGGEKLPDAFPKDFPVYQGAKVVSSVSNIQQGKGNGFLVTFTIPSGQGLNKVVPFYKSGLNTSGWTITSSFDSDTIQTWEIAKGSTEGSVAITSERDQMTVIVTLGDKK